MVTSNRGMAVFPRVSVSISTLSGPILVKLANEFNLSCLSSTSVKKKGFPVGHMKLRAFHQHQAGSWLDFFFIFHIVFTFILVFLSIFMANKRYIN